MSLDDAKVKYLPPVDDPVPDDFFVDFHATYEHDDDDPTHCRRAQVVTGLKILGGRYGAASHSGQILAERAQAHERLTSLTTEIAENGQRHAAILMLQTAACRRHNTSPERWTPTYPTPCWLIQMT